MAYNTTTKEKRLAAARDTAIKLKREKTIRNAMLIGYFLPIAKTFQKNYATTGAIPPLFDHNQDLINILNKNYSGTSDLFISQIRDSLGEPENEALINDQIESLSDTQQIIDINATNQSISNTTNNNLNKIVNDIIIAAALAGVFLTKKQIAKQARDKFISDSKGRLTGIGITQTQVAAESAKHNELFTLIRNNATFLQSGVNLGKDEARKTWVAILDTRTRWAHAKADSQTVDFNSFYIVGDQKLKFPGDMSLGATLDNIINCRCSSIKSIIKK